MLVLSRLKGERVIADFGDGVRLVVTVLEVCGRKVRLGFDAPRDLVLVNRQEVHDRIAAGRGAGEAVRDCRTLG